MSTVYKRLTYTSFPILMNIYSWREIEDVVNPSVRAGNSLVAFSMPGVPALVRKFT